MLLPCLVVAQKQYDIPKASPIPIDSITRMAIFQGVVSVDTSATVEELANRAKSWADRTYPSANRTLEEYDIFTGTLILKAVFTIEYLQYQLTLGLKSKKQLTVYHTITVEAKTGQCQIKINEFSTKEPDYRNQSGQLISSKSIPYIPKVSNDEIELQNEEAALAKRFNDESNRPKRNAPFYLASERNIDAAVYKAVSQVLSSFNKAIRKR